MLDFTHRLDTEQHASRAENEDMVILDLRSMERGDEIDTMLVFPDRTDLLNGLLSDNKEDTQVREFRKNLLNGIKKQGEVFVKYRDRKPNTDKARTKMAYLKIYPKRSWIIAQGFYFDELITKINQFKEQNRKLFHEKIRISLAVFCFTLLASLCISLFFLHKINSLFSKR